ncbi:MAG: nickel-dependent lactate racemase [Peptococcaceae bacterium]
MEYKFKYADSYIRLDLPDENIIKILQTDEIIPVTDIEQEVNRCLDNPLASKPFNDIFTKGDKVVIVASDITRLWIQVDKFLPFLVKRLNILGIPDEDIIILIATGTHREETPEERARVVGQEIYNRITVLDHNCQTSEMVMVGKTPRGTEVEINKLVAERKVILTGGIVHHLMAGYGGGRKSIVPGVASKKTIAQNHLHALDPQAKRSNPLIGVGATLNNPLNLDMIDCTKLIEPDFLVNSVVDTKGNIAKLFGGHWLKAWETGCKWTDDNFGVAIEDQADIVIASCGGFPKDMSLYQSTKTLFNAALAVKPGGTILLIAECREGAGADDFFNWSQPLKAGVLDPELRKNFTIPGYVFYAAVEIAQNAKVVLYSTIAPDLVSPMGIVPVNSISDALQELDLDSTKKIILMPYGGNTVPLCQMRK